MTRKTPEIQRELLNTHDGAQAIKVDAPEWFTWLAKHSVFRFTSSSGKFTARKEQRSAGWYWYAYRRQHSLLRTAYLGKSEELSLARLTEIAGILDIEPIERLPVVRLPDQHFLLATKMTPPALSTTIIARPRLIDKLRKHTASKLFLITGPAGSGKTTLLIAWLHAHQFPVAWISLDEGENELVRFWHYVLTAVQKIYPTLAAHLLSLLSTLQSRNMEAFLVLFVNALATLPEVIILALDDYHVVTNQLIHKSVAFLLEHAPVNLHIAISGRSLPPLSLIRLRAHGQLVELNFDDLRFSKEEAADLLQILTEHRPTCEELTLLLERTEGWATGLYLAALAWRGGQAKIPVPSGDQRYIFEYLASEVLAHQPTHVRDFLLHTSILHQLQADLCTAVTLNADSQNILRQLERENLFLSPLDDRHSWFRYHQLFTEFLRTQLEQLYPRQVEVLHSRAALWYAQNNQPAEAIAHALLADDFVLAARLIEEQGRNMLMQQEVVILSGWLHTLPAEVVFSHPRLCMFMAWVLLHTPHPTSIERYLCVAERSLESGDIAINDQRALYGEIAAIRARMTIYQSQIQQSVSYAQQALDWLAESDHYLRGEVALSLGTTSMLLGEIRGAQESFRVAIDLSWDCGNLRAALLAVRSLANLYVSQGRLHYAHRLYQDSLERIRQIGQEHIPPVGFLYIGLAEIYYEWNELDAAERHARQGIALGQYGGDVKIWLLGYIGLIYIMHARGESEYAWSLFHEAENLVRQASFTRGHDFLREVRARLNVIEGNFNPLLCWAQESNLDSADELATVDKDEYYLLAQALIVRSELDSALHLLERLLAQARQEQRYGDAIRFLLSLARVYEAQGKHERSLKTLEESLILAEPQNYLRTFSDEGVPVVVLLKKLRRTYQQRMLPTPPNIYGYLTRLLKSCKHEVVNQDTPQAVTQQLSKRELEVLRLLAAGYSNQEIAESLIIGLNTVKTHLSNIYGKLEARNRIQAVSHARALQIL